MTTAEQLEALTVELSAWHSQFGQQLSHAVAEREALTKERDRLRKALEQAESPCTCGHGRFGILHTLDCAITVRIAALKGTK